MSAPFKLIPTEKTYIAAVRHGLWKPEPGAPWGMIDAKRGRPSGKSHERNVGRILAALRKKPGQGYMEVSKAAGMCPSTAAKTLTQMLKDGQVTFDTVLTKHKTSNKVYKRRVYEAAP
jgi:hypothetical protein